MFSLQTKITFFPLGGIKLSGADVKICPQRPSPWELVGYENQNPLRFSFLKAFSLWRDILLNCRIHRTGWGYKAFVILDDAHGFGVLGNQGRGVCDHFGLPMKWMSFVQVFQNRLRALVDLWYRSRSVLYAKSLQANDLFQRLYLRSLCIRKTSPSSIAEWAWARATV